MNEREALRFAARRAAFLGAVSGGDAIVAARAASRLRIPSASLSPAQFAQALAARRTLGRAIVNARLPRVQPQPLQRVSAITAPRPSRRPLVATALVLIAVVLMIVIGGPDPGGESPTSASDSTPTAAEVQRIQLLSVSRGRTISLPVDVVAVQETPTPAPTATAAPTATPAAQPTRTTAPAGGGTRTGAPGAGGSGSGAGSSGGSTGGSGAGSGGGGFGLGILPTPRPTPTPTPAPTRPIPMPGFTRISVTVLDGRTFLPIADVCVLLNDRICTATKTRTDTRGKWSDDIPVSTAVVFWDIYFVKPGYATTTRRITLESQRTIQLQVFLFRN